MQNLNALTPPAYLSQSLFPIDQPPEFDLRSWLDSLPPPCQSSLDLSSLNVPQKSAVTHGAGPVLLIAGAGTGKTRTLVHRVAWLIEQGVPPEAILLLTFTRKAAQEMLNRAAQLTPQALRVFGGTFHSTASLLLRRHGHHLGISSDFTILDQSDSEGIIGLITSSLRLSGSGRRFPNSKTVFGFISAAVNKNCSIDEAVQQSQPHLIEFSEDFYRILDHYTEFKSKHNLLDYDDLLLHLFRLLTELPEARLEIASRFRHVLVDEYQDTNWLQSMLVKLLSSVHGNVMAVGDDAQSIYSFRGADHRNIMRFPDQHPGCAVIKLEQNYRSTAPILRFTNAALANAREKFDKQLFTVQPGGELPVLHAAASETAEARFVAEKIKELTVSGTALSEIAVLFRASHHVYRLELELAAAGLPFEKWGGIRLTESAHIKDVMACLRVLVNPQDRLSWHRLLLQIDHVGPKTAERILNTLLVYDNPFTALHIYPESFGSKAYAQGLRRLSEAFDSMRLPGLAPAFIFELAMRHYQPVLERVHYEDYPARQRDLDRIHTLAASFTDLRAFVDEFSLNPPQAALNQGCPLIASTVHSAKGKEFDAVFVIGLAEHRFPSCNEESLNFEEERRLFYVAATRARKHLFLTYPKTLITPDRKCRCAEVSPFIQEIDQSLFSTYGEES